MNKLGATLKSSNWLDFCCLLYGVILLTEFFSLLERGFFSATGMHDRLIDFSGYAANPWIHSLIKATLNYSAILAPICAFFMLVAAICLSLLILRTYMMYLAGIIFICYFIFHLSLTNTWLFEYLLPVLFAICISLAKTPDLKLQGGKKLLGMKLLQGKVTALHIFGLIFSAALLWIFFILANNAGDASFKVASTVSLVYLILFSIMLYLEKFRVPRQTYNNEIELLESSNLLYKRLHNIPWLDVMAIVVGIMLVFQMYENQLLSWFTVGGYKGLIEVYKSYTNAPGLTWILNVSLQKAWILLPVQIAVEMALSLLLVTQLYRAPTLLVTFLFLFFLTYVEFGVPSSWPITESTEPTWMWELLLTSTIVCMIGLYQIGKFITEKEITQRCLGNSIFGETKFYIRVIISFVVATILFLIITVSYEVAKHNFILATASSLTLFFYMLILSAIDLSRSNRKRL